MKQEVIKAIETHKIIAILRGIPKDKLLKTAQALYDGGIRLLEITYSADGLVSDAETAEKIELLADYFKNKMYIGAGTVLNESQVQLTKDAGGTFIISPDICESVIKETVRLDMVSIPGGMTPTEITTAHRAGADFVKIFPASNLGPSYIKAIKAPLSHIKLLAVGGINPSNMADYWKAGVCGFGLGSNLADQNLVAKDDYNALTNLAKTFTSVIHHG